MRAAAPKARPLRPGVKVVDIGEEGGGEVADDRSSDSDAEAEALNVELASQTAGPRKAGNHHR